MNNALYHIEPKEFRILNRPVYETSYHMVVGFMTAEQINRKTHKQRIEKYNKVLVAVPGTDIEELLKELQLNIKYRG